MLQEIIDLVWIDVDQDAFCEKECWLSWKWKTV